MHHRSFFGSNHFFLGPRVFHAAPGVSTAHTPERKQTRSALDIGKRTFTRVGATTPGNFVICHLHIWHFLRLLPSGGCRAPRDTVRTGHRGLHKTVPLFVAAFSMVSAICVQKTKRRLCALSLSFEGERETLGPTTRDEYGVHHVPHSLFFKTPRSALCYNTAEPDGGRGNPHV